MDKKIKKCGNCGKLKLVSEFYKDKSHKDGLMTRCSACVRKYNKSYSKSYYNRMKKDHKFMEANRIRCKANYYKRKQRELTKIYSNPK